MKTYDIRFPSIIERASQAAFKALLFVSLISAFDLASAEETTFAGPSAVVVSNSGVLNDSGASSVGSNDCQVTIRFESGRHDWFSPRYLAGFGQAYNQWDTQEGQAVVYGTTSLNRTSSRVEKEDLLWKSGRYNLVSNFTVLVTVTGSAVQMNYDGDAEILYSDPIDQGVQPSLYAALFHSRLGGGSSGGVSEFSSDSITQNYSAALEIGTHRVEMIVRQYDNFALYFGQAIGAHQSLAFSCSE